MAVFPADSSHDWACMNLKNRIGSADGPGTSTSVFFLGVLLVPKLCHVLYPLFLYLSTWHCGCVCSSDVRELTVSR